MTWQNDARKILVGIFGLVNAGAGFFFLWLEMNGKEAHSTHVYLFVGWIAVGMLIVAPSVIGSALKQVVSYLPSIKIGKSD